MGDSASPPAVVAAAPVSSPKKARIYHSLAEKISICIAAERLAHAKKKLSFKAFCRERDLDPFQLRRWQSNNTQTASIEQVFHHIYLGV